MQKCISFEIEIISGDLTLFSFKAIIHAMLAIIGLNIGNA
jgi:hypothetical protein